MAAPDDIATKSTAVGGRDGEASSGTIALDDMAILRFAGGDACGFLQGYLTADTAHLGTDPHFCALCNIKGRVVCSGLAWRDGDAVLLVLHQSLCAIVTDFLRPYLAFSKTNAVSLPAEVIGVLGPTPPTELLSLPGGRIDEKRWLFVRQSDAGNAAGDADRAHSTADIARHRWQEALIDEREVWLQATTSGQFLPQMLGLVERGAISFSKGCYLGQEVVARAQHRGAVKRKLTELSWSGDAPSVGSAIEANGRAVGTVVATSVAGAVGRALAVFMGDQPGPFASPSSATRFTLKPGL